MGSIRGQGRIKMAETPPGNENRLGVGPNIPSSRTKPHLIHAQKGALTRPRRTISIDAELLKDGENTTSESVMVMIQRAVVERRLNILIPELENR